MPAPINRQLDIEPIQNGTCIAKDCGLPTDEKGFCPAGHRSFKAITLGEEHGRAL